MEEKNAPDTSSFNTFEEYRLIVEDTARMTDRRQNNNTLYLTINTTLLAGLLIILENSNAEAGEGITSILPSGGIIEPKWVIFTLAISLFFAAVGLNITWWRMIGKYKNLLNLRFRILEEIEGKPKMDGSIQVYQRENKEFYQDEKKKLSFSKMERFLPAIFIGLYILLAILITLVMIQIP